MCGTTGQFKHEKANFLISEKNPQHGLLNPPWRSPAYLIASSSSAPPFPHCIAARDSFPVLWENSISSHFVSLQVSIHARHFLKEHLSDPTCTISSAHHVTLLRAPLNIPVATFPHFPSLYVSATICLLEPLQLGFVDHEDRDHFVLFTTLSPTPGRLNLFHDTYGVLRRSQILC